MKKGKRYLNVLALVVSAVIVGLDQYFKFLVVENLKTEGSFLQIWDGVFQLTYVRNHGAAFGIFAGKTFLLVGLTGIIILLFIALVGLNKIKHPCLLWSLSLIIGGGIGNIIDRINLGYVVDYLHVTLINFAVFNFADCCVVVGTILLIVYFLFFDRKKEKPEEENRRLEEEILTDDEPKAE